MYLPANGRIKCSSSFFLFPFLFFPPVFSLLLHSFPPFSNVYFATIDRCDRMRSNDSNTWRGTIIVRDEKFCRENLLETQRKLCDRGQFLIRIDISISCRDTSSQSFRDIYIYITRIMNGSALGELLGLFLEMLTTPFQESYYVLLCFPSSRDCRPSG